MKTKNVLQLIALSGLIFVASCKKDKSSDGQKFSPLTVEQNKAKIEDEGIAMLNTVKEMESSPSIDAASNMMDYVNKADMFENNPGTSTKSNLLNELLKPVMIASNLKNFNAKHVANDLKVQLVPETLLSVWNEVKGTYTWNSSTYSWDWTTGNDITIKFPSTETGTTNNVVFRVYDFLTEAGPFSWTEDYYGELPKQIKSDLKVDGNSLLIYSLNITYLNNDKKPNSLSTSIELPPFKFAFDVTNNNNADASVSFKWSKTTTTLVALSLSATGNWTESNINQENLEPGDVFYTGNASFQLMNLKVVGNVDVKNLNKEINAISSTLTEEQSVTKECEIISKYASLYVCYADNNLIIAKVVTYPVLKTDKYWDYVYNASTQKWEFKEVTETYWEVTPKFQFADNSSADMDSYFGENNFSELKTAIDDYMNDLQTNYGK